jgi:hypothetical protein
MGFFHRAECSLDLAFCPGRVAPLILAVRHVQLDLHAQVGHDTLENAAPSDGAVMHVQHRGNTLERKLRV